MRSSALLPLLASIATALPAASVEVANVARSIVARAPPEAKAVLKSVSSSGTGCAPNSAQFLIDDDAMIAFDSLSLDTATTVSSKRCIVAINLQVDPKWKYSINKFSNVRGFVDGASATFKAVYSIGGKTSEVKTDIKPASAPNGNFLYTSKQAGVTSPYGGGNSTIDITLALIRDSVKDGAIAVDSLDIGFEYSQ